MIVLRVKNRKVLLFSFELCHDSILYPAEKGENMTIAIFF